MLRIGITERGDAGLDLSWAERLHTINRAILITKALTEPFREAVRPVADRVLVHGTCTGHGGGALEPGVPPLLWTVAKYDRLLHVLPPPQTVLRLDPIIPTPKGLAIAARVLQVFADSPVQRVRFSFLDMYPHVTARFAAAGLPHPYAGAFGPSAAQRAAAHALLARWTSRYQFEACTECGVLQVGCLSVRDAGPLRFDPAALAGGSRQRAGCRCPRNKVELLTRKAPCPHGCRYCYWQGVGTTPALSCGPSCSSRQCSPDAPRG